MGLAIHNFESGTMTMPDGWMIRDRNDALSTSGWGWSATILPFMEQTNLFNQIDFSLRIDDPFNVAASQEVIESHLCPSDPQTQLVLVEDIESPVGDGSGNRLTSPIAAPQDSILMLPRSNYSGVFGNILENSDPLDGDGVFYGNSGVRFRDVLDGLSNTLLIGERRNDFGAVSWVGVVENAPEPFARIVGATDNPPNNNPVSFQDFRSYHPGGINVIYADGSLQFLNDSVDLTIYQGLGSIAGGESGNLR